MLFFLSVSLSSSSSSHPATMDLINKLIVLMKASLAGTEVKNESSKKSSESEKCSSSSAAARLSHHYLAQCLHKQCDMYELREMCRLQQVAVKRGAGKREIIESLIDHLPNVNLDSSPRELANKTRKTGKKSKAAMVSSSTTSPSPSSRLLPSSASRYADENAQSFKRVPGPCFPPRLARLER